MRKPWNGTVLYYCLKQDKDDEQGTVAKWKPKIRHKPADTVNTVLEVLLKYGKKTEAWSLFEKLCGIAT